jgi:hypothetical protein
LQREASGDPKASPIAATIAVQDLHTLSIV